MLDLTVTDPNNTPYYPNGGNVHDHTNNVQGVDIPSPVTGTYKVTVSGYNVPSGLQPYALVVSGPLPGGYISVAVTTSSGGPIPGVTINIASVTGPATNQSAGTGLNGGYSVNLIPNTTYTVTPSKTQWTFTPASITGPVNSVGASEINFTGSAAASSITGTVSRTVGGTIDYSLDSPHPYDLWCDSLYTITGDPTATSISVHFQSIDLYNDGATVSDEITVEDTAGNVLNDFVGNPSNTWQSDWEELWSNPAPGNTIYVRLLNYGESYYGELGWGFHIDGYQTNLVPQGGLTGVSVSAATVSSSACGATSNPSSSTGAYSIGNLAPITYNVTPSLGNWIFTPNVQEVALSPGAASTGSTSTLLPRDGHRHGVYHKSAGRARLHLGLRHAGYVPGQR